jgi:phosphate transport system substrate-binding protein
MKKKIVLGYVLVCLAFACNQPNNKPNPLQMDTATEGTIYISVDESFKPVIEEQIKVFESAYPKARVVASYKSEADCFRDLQRDSTRMIVVARGLKKDEENYYYQEMGQFIPNGIVAYDAVAVIVNANSKDSVFTIEHLKNILSGKDNKVAVMDGKNATSTVRYLQDTILKTAAFGSNVVAAGGSQAVIDAVAKAENAVGFVGLSWLGNQYDTKQQEQFKKIRFALLECAVCDEKGTFAKPSQATITYLQYPLARPLHYILKENWSGVGGNFAGFMKLERGQLIFRRSFLAPALINFKVRKSNIDEK